MSTPPGNLVINYDGGVRGGCTAATWTIKGNGLIFDWQVLAEGGKSLPSGSTVTEAELTAQEQGVRAALALLQQGLSRGTKMAQLYFRAIGR